MDETRLPGQAPDIGGRSRTSLPAPAYVLGLSPTPSGEAVRSRSYIRVDVVAPIAAGAQRYRMEMIEDFRARHIAYVPAVVAALLVGGMGLIAAGAKFSLAALPFVLAALAVGLMSGYLSFVYVPDDDGEYVEIPRP